MPANLCFHQPPRQLPARVRQASAATPRRSRSSARSPAIATRSRRCLRRTSIAARRTASAERRIDLTNDYTLDARQYLPISSRALLATRLFAGYSRGDFPNFYYFGGLNTVRGYEFRSIIGTQAAFANVELRFPLIDVLATPIMAFTRHSRQSLLRHRRREAARAAIHVLEGPPAGQRRGRGRLRRLVQFARPRTALGFRETHRPPATSTASSGRSSGSARCLQRRHGRQRWSPKARPTTCA